MDVLVVDVCACVCVCVSPEAPALVLLVVVFSPAELLLLLEAGGCTAAAAPIPEVAPWLATAGAAVAPKAVAATAPEMVVAVAPATVATAAAVAAVAMAGTCGVGCAAGTSVALLSGRAMEMSESRRSSFSVSSELRRMTGCDSMFISWPSGDASRLRPPPSASPAPPRGTVFMEALPLRLTFMLSSLTSRSQKSVEMPRDWAVPTEQEEELPPPRELWEAEEGLTEEERLPWERQLELDALPSRRVSRSEAEEVSRSLQRCWVKWLGNTCRQKHTHTSAHRHETLRAVIHQTLQHTHTRV